MWVRFLRFFNAQNLIKYVEPSDSFDIVIGSASCKTGYGGYLGRTAIAGIFPESWCSLDIQTLELYPILAIVGTYAGKLVNHTVLVKCDNQPLVYCLNSFTSRNPRVLHLLRILVLLPLHHNIALKAEYLTSEDNYICDVLYRRQVSGSWLARQGLRRSLGRIAPTFRPNAWRSVITLQ